MSSRTSIGGDAGRAALLLALARGLLGGCASTAQPAIAQWCPQPESAGDERCPAREENTP